MNKELLYNKYKGENIYIYKDEKIYDYQIDNSYYKSYGKISRDTIKLTLSDDKQYLLQ